MGNGYLIVRCLQCGSISRLDVKAVRTKASLCPVCLDGETECRLVQYTIQNYFDQHKYFSENKLSLVTEIIFSNN